MEPFDLDQLAAWADGRLSAAEARALEAALAADPALAREAEAFRLVTRATAHLREDAPRPGVSFDQLRLDDAPLHDTAAPTGAAESAFRGRWWAIGLAAAVLVAVTAWVLGGFGGTGGTARPESANVVLAAIPLSQEPLEPPAVLLTGYDPGQPTEQGGPRWLSAEREATEVARYTGRPVFVYASYEGCPLCRKMEATTFRDADVRALLAKFVPVRLGLERATPEEAKRYFEAGWPYLAVRTADGTEVAQLSGMQTPASMKQRLTSALEKAPATAPAATWSDLGARAKRDVDLRAGRAALLAARDGAGADPVHARATLAEAAARLSGTDAGRDLAHVLDVWRADRPFPVLVEPSK